MKTVSDFKKRIHVGVKLHTIYHMKFNGRDTENNPVYTDEDKGIREVSIAGSTQFALKTIKENGNIADSWLSFPKSSECEFVGEDTIIIFETLNNKRSKLITYTFIK